MKSYQYAGPALGPRSHPWTSAVDDPAARYLDLQAEPALIRTALEDFVPWARYPAVERFYALVEWVNGGDGPLASNDCAFVAPHPNQTAAVAKALECSGRLMILFRDLARNQDPALVARLTLALHQALAARDRVFAWGAVGTTVVPVRYLALPGEAAEQQGEQLLVSWWAWGATEAETLAHLARVIENLDRALRVAVTAVAP